MCAQRNFCVEGKVAYEKWSCLQQIYKDINDRERNAPSGKNSYQSMTVKERTAEKKFSHNSFERGVYKMMERCMSYDPMHEPPPSVIDTSNGQF